jgi:hypothetical protein
MSLMKRRVNPKNQFLATAGALWASGADGQAVACDLAEALADVIIEGTGPRSVDDIVSEFRLLLKKRGIK